MPQYHPDAEREVDAILQQAGRGVKRCLGMMIQRHLRIANGSEPLDSAELLGAGSGASTLYEVHYSYAAWSSVTCIYQLVGPDVTVLAVDAVQGTVRLGPPSNAPDARARAWGRSS
jgi:hypothetical protein